MKLARILFALILLTAAGVASAAQPAAHSSEAPDAQETIASDGEGPLLPALGSVLVQPAETVGVICYAECIEDRQLCLEQCPDYGEEDWQACITACSVEYEECTAVC